MDKPYKARESGMIIIRLFLLGVFGVAAWAGFDLLHTKPAAAGSAEGVPLNLFCVLPLTLFTVVMGVILARAIFAAPFEWAENRRLVKARAAIDARPHALPQPMNTKADRRALEDAIHKAAEQRAPSAEFLKQAKIKMEKRRAAEKEAAELKEIRKIKDPRAYSDALQKYHQDRAARIRAALEK